MEKAGGKGFVSNRGGIDEDSLAELKSIHQGLTALKVQYGKRLDDLRAEMLAGFEINSNALLEAKINERLADTVTALTRQSADRMETKKAHRILEKQQKNMFDILTFILNQLGGQVLIPPNLLAEIGQHSTLYSTNMLASHVQLINGASQRLKSEAEAMGEYLKSKTIPSAAPLSVRKTTEQLAGEVIKGPLYHSARKVQKQNSLNLTQSINFGKAAGLPGI